jgi:SOS-response transcriptional repressor LexA
MAGMDMHAHRRRRLQELIDEEDKGNAAAFARRYGLDATRVRQLLNPNYRDGNGFGEGAGRALAKKIGREEFYFNMGIEQHEGTAISVPAEMLHEEKKTGLTSGASDESGIKISKTDTLPGPNIGEKVPLLSWDQARTWDKLMEILEQKEVDQWLLCPAPHSVEAFCLENNTDTMDDGTRDGYREGDILFVDPAVPAMPEKDVIVLFPDGRMTIRRLKEDGEGRYLLALNGKRIERWKEGTIVRGVVIFSGNFR